MRRCHFPRLVLGLATFVLAEMISGLWNVSVWVGERTKIAITSGQFEHSRYEDHVRERAREDESRSWEFNHGSGAIRWWFNHRAWGYGEAWAVPLWPLPLIGI